MWNALLYTTVIISSSLYIKIKQCSRVTRLRVVPLSFSPSCATRKTTAGKNGCANSWRREASAHFAQCYHSWYFLLILSKPASQSYVCSWSSFSVCLSSRCSHLCFVILNIGLFFLDVYLSTDKILEGQNKNFKSTKFPDAFFLGCVTYTTSSSLFLPCKSCKASALKAFCRSYKCENYWENFHNRFTPRFC